jgi:hypothetical protein
MGCGSSASLPQDPEKFPSHLLFNFIKAHIKPVALHRNDQLSKEHVFQLLLQVFRWATCSSATQLPVCTIFTAPQTFFNANDVLTAATPLTRHCDSAQMDVVGQYKSNFIRLSKDNHSLQLQNTLWSVNTPVEFWNAAEAGKKCHIKISLWSRQVHSAKAANVDHDASAELVGDVGVAVGGAAGSDGEAMFSMLRDTLRRRIKVETMSPLLLSTSELAQKFGENNFVVKDELNTQVADITVRFGSCNRSAAELEEELNQHMMAALHQRRLGQKLLNINEYAQHHSMKVPHCSPEELERIVEALKVSSLPLPRL